MPRLADPLTELKVRNAKPTAKPYTLSDGNGLSLLVSPAALKTWQVRYRLADGIRPAPATIGHYPLMSLAEARNRAVEIQRDAKLGKATVGTRKARQEASATVSAVQAAEMLAKEQAEQATFRAVSGRWLSEKRPSWAPATYSKACLVVDSHLVPKLGDADMRTLETKDVRPVILEMAKTIPQLARTARHASTSAASWSRPSTKVCAPMKARSGSVASFLNFAPATCPL